MFVELPVAVRVVLAGWMKLALVAGLGLLASLAVAQPANDNFTNAAVISGLSGALAGTNNLATLEAGEPDFINTDDFAGVAKSVWYRWIAPSNGVVAFDTFGGDFDTVLAVYTNAPTLGNLVTANDDYITLFVVQSRLTFTAVAGTTYYISVNGNQSPAPGWSDAGSFVLNWKETVPTVPSGTFLFTAATYNVSDGDASSPGDPAMASVPTWVGARVTVTRTKGYSGRVLVPYVVTGDSNQPAATVTNGLLIFDDYQMSADIRVTLSAVAVIPAPDTNTVAYAPPNQIAVTLGTPILDPLESTDLIPPVAAGVTNTIVNVVSWNKPASLADRAATLPFFYIERTHFRCRESQGNAVVYVYPSRAPRSDERWALNYTFDHSSGLIDEGPSYNTFPLEAGSDYATPGVDFVAAGGTFTWEPGDASRRAISIPITDDPDPEFNEDLEAEIYYPRDTAHNNAVLALGQISKATVTILFDDQPAGAVDRTWNKDGANDSLPPFLQYPGTQGGISDSANGNGGTVYAAAEQPDGKVIIAGSFISYDSNPYNRIVRVLANGYQDPAFQGNFSPWYNSGADDTINCVVLQPDGKILIGGNFTSFNGASRYRVARLNANGSVDTTFTPGAGANGKVFAISLQSDGKIYIAGAFTAYNNTNCSYLARLNDDGSLDTAFNPGDSISQPVYALAVPASGTNSVYAGGAFTHIGGVTYGCVARFNGDGSVDAAFNPGIGTYNPKTGTNDPVYALALQPDGKLVVGGTFSTVEMIAINGITRFNPDGTLDAGFSTVGALNGTYNPVTGVADRVNVITLQADGNILLGGDFANVNQTRRIGLARLFRNGSLDTSFMDTAYNQFAGPINHYHNIDAINTNDYPQGNHLNSIRAIALEADGDVIVGGNFLRFGGGSYAHSGPAKQGVINNGRLDTHPRSNVARLIGGGTPGPGNLELSYDRYSVDKSAGTLFVSLVRSNGNLGTIAANFYSPLAATNQQGIARLGTDFTIGNLKPTWATMWSSSWTRSVAFEDQNYVGSAGNNAAETLTIINNTNFTGNVIANLALVAPAFDLFSLGGETIPLGAALGLNQTSPMTIIDGNFPAGTFSFSAPSYTVNENASTATVTLVRTNGTKGIVTVYYRTFNGTAISPTDYTSVSDSLTFADGDTSQSFTVPIIPSTANQPDKTINLLLYGVTGGGKPGLTNAVLTIVNNVFGAGHVALAFATNTVAENAGVAGIVLNRLGSSTGTLDVTAITSDGSAVNGVNYVGSTNVIHWDSADALPKTITIPVKRDWVYTTNLTVNLRLTNGLAGGRASAYVLGLSAITNATLVITNVDFPGTVEFSAAAYSVKKYGGTAHIPVIRTGGSAGTLTVTNYTVDGTALSGMNYIGQTNVLTFTNGQVSRFFDVPVIAGATGGLVSLNLFLTNATVLNSPLPWNASGSPARAVLNIIDTTPTNPGAVLETPGSPDITYSPLSGFDDAVLALALQSNNQLIVGGDFTMACGVYRQRLARLNEDGTLDPTFLFPSAAFGADNSIRTLALQSDGRILVGGFFTNLNSVVRHGIARLNYDGSLDSRFNPGSGADNPVYAVAETFVSGQRKILVAGSFTRLNGVVANGFGCLDGDGINGQEGRPDASFNPGGAGANGKVYALAVQTDGKILLGGDFTTVNGVSANHIARLNVDGSVDLSFTNATANDSVRAIALQLDGQILVGGLFTSANGSTNFNHLARLNSADGSADNSFTPGLGADDGVFTIAVQTDNRIVLGGEFTHCSGVQRNRITRLNPDGTVDPTINFGVGADSFVQAVVIEQASIHSYPTNVPDEKIIIGGGFTRYYGESHPHLARIYGGSMMGVGNFEFSSGAYSVNENGTNVVITINRVGGTSGPNTDGSGNVFVTCFTTDGTARADTDHAGATNYFSVVANLTFVPGEVQQTVVVSVQDDRIITPDLTVNLGLTPQAPAEYGGQPTAVLTIVNVDSAISFSAPAYLAAKYAAGAPDGQAAVDINRLGSTVGTSTVTFNTAAGGTAVPGVDYQSVTNVLVTFAPGVSTQTMMIPVINGVSDGDQTVALQLTNPTGSALVAPSNAVLTIQDRTLARGSFRFSSTDYGVSEGGGSGYANCVITVVRTNGVTGTVTVGYGTSDGTAVAGAKYVPTSGVLTFDRGEISKTFTVQVLNTGTVEPTEFFSVWLANATGGAGLTDPTNATVTILNTNTGVAFLAATNTFDESGLAATLTVQRYNNTQGTSTIYYTITNGTAVAGVNFVDNGAPHQLVFNDGAAQAVIFIPLIYDTNYTGDKQFTVGLVNPSAGMQIGTPGMTTVILRDVDVGVGFTNATASVLKNAGSLAVTVHCYNTNAGPVSVSYATADGTATNHAVGGRDYAPTSGLLTFSNGIADRTFSVPILYSSANPGDHVFEINLSNPTSPGRLVPPSQMMVTIVDSDSALRFSSADFTVLKTAGAARITVYRTGYANSVAAVNFMATNGTALAGLNFIATNGTLVFAPGVVSNSFTVPIIGSTTVQPDRTVLLQLTSPVNGLLAAPSAALLTIHDDTGSFVVPAGAQLLSEIGAGAPNGLIDPGETVQILFAFRVAGGTNVNNLVATLLPSSGITPVNPVTKIYGPLAYRGHSASQPFTFTAAGTNRQQIVATFRLQDGALDIGTNVFGFSLGSWTAVYSNTTPIVINDNTNASPYPSTINVSQVGGSLVKATVTLSKFSHTSPKDVAALVVAPSGLNTLIMAGAGGGNAVTNLVLTFDDAAAASLSATNRLTNGVYKPTQYYPVKNFP